MTNQKMKEMWVADYLAVDPNTQEGGQAVFEWLFENILLTFPQWKKLGFYVKKGEHAFAKIDTWHPKKGKNPENEEEIDGDNFTGEYFKKIDFYFTYSQVAKMEVKKDA